MNINWTSIGDTDVQADWCLGGEGPECQVEVCRPVGAISGPAEGVADGEGQVCHPQAGPGVGHSPWVFLIDQCGHILTGTLGGRKEVLTEVKRSQLEPQISTDCPAPVSAAPVGFLNCPSLGVTLLVHLTNVY